MINKPKTPSSTYERARLLNRHRQVTEWAATILSKAVNKCAEADLRERMAPSSYEVH